MKDEKPMIFPVDESTLMAVEHSLDAVLEFDSDGDPVVVGADYSIWDLLEFLSGVTADDYELEDGDECEEEKYYVCTKPCFHPNDVIRALIEEVRRLRDLVPDELKELGYE